MTPSLEFMFSEFLTNLTQSERAQVEKLSPQLTVTCVTSDSREVVPGAIYVAVRGGSADGHHFLREAEKKGALVLVGEEEVKETHKIPYLRVKNSRLALAQLASRFYHDPSDRLLMVGVTGTSGKTTTSYLVESILKEAGHQVGVIGTVNFRYGSKIFPSTHTTPGPAELQNILYQMKTEGCTAVVMEVSSHALKQKRTAFIAFDGMIFTNLSPEHLDFHLDMEDYFRSKSLLFTECAEFAKRRGKNPVGIINQADLYGTRLIQELEASNLRHVNVKTFDAEEGLKSALGGITGQIDGISIQSELTGLFNCANIAGAVKLADALRVAKDKIELGVRNLKGVPGRLERIPNSKGVHVWVDYAHKPDALENVLKTLNEVRGNHQLITVFGCGGDRDRKKRPVMGKIAIERSTQVIVTSDNPRTEDPLSIIREILLEIQTSKKLNVEPDRRKAIFKAIRLAKPGDLVLIAGKGHEDYQILGHKKVHFDDREVAAEALQSNESGEV